MRNARKMKQNISCFSDAEFSLQFMCSSIIVNKGWDVTSHSRNQCSAPTDFYTANKLHGIYTSLVIEIPSLPFCYGRQHLFK